MSQSLPPHLRPTQKQISYLMTLTGIRQSLRLQRFVARRMNKVAPEAGGPGLTKFDFSRAIDMELRERRLAA
jgi:hypothetical protein